jgi:hypothetical protein
MTQQHPFPHPPLVLLHQWMDEAEREKKSVVHHVAEKTAQWASDCELKACCEVLNEHNPSMYWSEILRSRRRPEPKTLKEEALKELAWVEEHFAIHTIRRALEELPDNE